jgi:DNA modification methylase
MNNKKLSLNKIICSDSIKGLKKLPSESIDLVVTSPPYDQLRDYKKKPFDLNGTGEEIYRVLKDGSICAVVIQDQTKNFGKSLTSFKTAVHWCEKFNFKLFETVIYRKHGIEGAWWTKRFRVDHEYIHLFLKGERPNYFNKEPLKIPSKHGGKTMRGSGNRKTDGTTTETTTIHVNKMKCRGTVWNYLMAGDKNKLKQQHPAVFPDKIPYDLINCFCKPKGVVLDPFMGSGSTAVTALQLKRNFIGYDISKEYCDIAKKRIKNVQVKLIE